MSDHLYHLVPQSKWQECKKAGKQYLPPTYAQDGFIHLTKEPELLLPVANHFYKGEQGAYIVLRLDPGKLTSEVKFEAAAPVGDKATSDFGGKKSEEQNFPHLYGAIDEAAVVTELGVQRQEDGTFTGIDGL